ncbi:MAG: LPS export ABC transporter ATP-binding protein [Legionellales bacterium]|nr:LPS export ABC transporter ATP-binding protein [Legionellales bacterium]
MNTLKAENISKKYQRKTIINDVNIAVAQNEIIGILGPNGAGKSTTFHVIAGLTKCDSGKVLLNGVDITTKRLPKRAKLGVAYLPQDSSIFRGLTVRDNIYSVLELQTHLSKDEKHAKTEEILNQFQLMKIRNTLGTYVSGGERRRVEVARALAISPKFILLDEPFAGIDPVSISEIKQIIIDIKNNDIGVIITDHNVRETLKICDRADIMHNGEIIQSGTAKQILSNDKIKEIYLGHEFYI